MTPHEPPSRAEEEHWLSEEADDRRGALSVVVRWLSVVLLKQFPVCYDDKIAKSCGMC